MTRHKNLKLYRDVTMKKSFALRINAEILAAVEKWAADEFRSVNGQIEWMLNKSLRDAGRLRKKKDNEEK